MKTSRAPSAFTHLLLAWQAGSAEAGEQVIAQTYDELRRIARGYLRRERPGHILQPTALLNEVFVGLLPAAPGAADSRETFLRLMASEMRRRLVDHARRRDALKRGGGVAPASLDDLGLDPGAAPPADDVHATLDALDRALAELARDYPRVSGVVQHRFFLNLTIEETAARLGISLATAKRDWKFAKAWLAAALEEESS
jgi:RNA polymerase sigma factor (TIGR02999 family)